MNGLNKGEELNFSLIPINLIMIKSGLLQHRQDLVHYQLIQGQNQEFQKFKLENMFNKCKFQYKIKIT
jgi:hypothetical protein